MTTPRSSLDVVAVVVENLFPVAETLPPVAGTLYPLPKPLASRATPHLRERERESESERVTEAEEVRTMAKVPSA